MATTFDVIFLGTAVDLDLLEGGTTAGNAGAIVGTTFGSSGDPLHENVHSWSPGSTGYSGGTYNWAYDTDNDTSNDTFSIDGGGDQTVDAAIFYNATVTYADGSTDTVLAHVVQDTSGNLYLAPHLTLDANQLIMEAGAIESIQSIIAVKSSGWASNGSPR